MIAFIDAFFRRVIGWRVFRTAHVGFVLDTQEEALHEQRPVQGGDLIHHRDGISQGDFNRALQRFLRYHY